MYYASLNTVTELLGYNNNLPYISNTFKSLIVCEIWSLEKQNINLYEDVNKSLTNRI